jgi:hypothetical protein
VIVAEPIVIVVTPTLSLLLLLQMNIHYVGTWDLLHEALLSRNMLILKISQQPRLYFFRNQVFTICCNLCFLLLPFVVTYKLQHCRNFVYGFENP